MDLDQTICGVRESGLQARSTWLTTEILLKMREVTLYIQSKQFDQQVSMTEITTLRVNNTTDKCISNPILLVVLQQHFVSQEEVNLPKLFQNSRTPLKKKLTQRANEDRAPVARPAALMVTASSPSPRGATAPVCLMLTARLGQSGPSARSGSTQTPVITRFTPGEAITSPLQ